MASILPLFSLTAACLLAACATQPPGRTPDDGVIGPAVVAGPVTGAARGRGRGAQPPGRAGQPGGRAGRARVGPLSPDVQVRKYKFEETGEMLEYAVFVSSKVKKGTKAPLVIALHGRGVGPTSIMAHLTGPAEQAGFIVAAPMGYNERGWFGQFDTDRSTPPQIREYSEKDVMNVLAFMRAEFDIDEKRIYLMGQSMGGSGAAYLAVKHSSIWAAVSLGAPPIRSATHGETIDGIPNIRHIPFILVHGERDALVTVEVSRRLSRRMTSLGMTYEYREISGGSHPDAIYYGAPWIISFFERHAKTDTLAGPALLASTPAAAQPLNKTATPLPGDLRNGTGTMEQVNAWMLAEKAHLPSVPAEQITFPAREQDLDFDGMKDVLIERSASAGGEYSAFLKTSRGHRFIGTFYGAIRPLPLESGQRSRFVIASAMGSARAHVRLVELQPDGLHQIATAILAAGDSGSAEGNRAYRDLMSADVVSAETLRQIFGGG